LLNALTPQITILACYHNIFCVRTSLKCYMLANISSIFTI
jgi:hypothetical protein